MHVVAGPGHGYRRGRRAYQGPHAQHRADPTGPGGLQLRQNAHHPAVHSVTQRHLRGEPEQTGATRTDPAPGETSHRQHGQPGHELCR